MSVHGDMGEEVEGIARDATRLAIELDNDCRPSYAQARAEDLAKRLIAIAARCANRAWVEQQAAPYPKP